MKRVSFSEDCPTASWLMQWYGDVRRALGDMEDEILVALVEQRPTPDAFLGMTEAEVSAYFEAERDELELVVSLELIASAEAVLRKDYLSRVYEKKKDPVSKRFRVLYNEKVNAGEHGTKVSLEKDLLEVWKNEIPECRSAIGEFMSILKLRHWLAHGRWWEPKLGRGVDQYTAEYIWDVTELMFKKLPGVTGWPGDS